jgi:antitoxin (DNA-binding transcriptional repressor) of toxin-antitoxin stability system
MEDVTLPYAKEHLEDLIARATRGEEVCISDPKLGTIRLAPIIPSSQPAKLYPERVIGSHKHIPDSPLERLLAPLSADELAWLSGEQSEVE